MHKILTCGFLTLALAVAPAAGAQFQFDPAASYLVGPNPSDVAAADFDRDGDRDLAATVDAPDRLVLLLNQGNGSFVPGGSIQLGSNAGAGSVEAGDFNGDGNPDAAVALQNQASVRIVLGNGAGAFTLGGAFATGVDPRGLDAADYDGDGDLDLVCGNRNSNTATVLTNDGGANFAATTLAGGVEPRGAAFGDFDGDGDEDVAISNHDSRSVTVYRTQGSASFVLGTTLSTGTQLRPEGVRCADLDNDGDDDIVAAANANNLEVALVFLSLGGGFSAFQQFNSGGVDTGAVEIADLDCDGAAEIVTANQGSANLSLLQNLGGGSFAAPQLLAAGAQPNDLTAADLDNDGDLDLAAANQASGSVTVHLNQTCSAPALLLAVTGACPGLMTATVDNATPGANVAFAYAFSAGSFAIPAGLPCAGLVLGLDSTARHLTTTLADPNGRVVLDGNAPAGACGTVLLQAVDLAACAASNVAAL